MDPDRVKREKKDQKFEKLKEEFFLLDNGDFELMQDLIEEKIELKKRDLALLRKMLQDAEDSSLSADAKNGLVAKYTQFISEQQKELEKIKRTLIKIARMSSRYDKRIKELSYDDF